MKIGNILRKVIGNEIEVHIKNSYLMVHFGKKIHLIKYLIVEEAEFGLRDMDPQELYTILERFTAVFSKLPPGSEVKTIRLARDLRKIRRNIENEMLNIKAAMETIKEPHVMKKLERRLDILTRIYSRILSANDIVRVVTVFKIRGEADPNSVNDVITSMERLADIIKSLFSSSLGFKIRDASEKEIKDIIKYEIGIIDSSPVKSILIEDKRLTFHAPLPRVKKPAVENYTGIYVGIDIDTGWPVFIDKEMFHKHMLIVGPTGRGKTTTLALIIENYISLYGNTPLVIDFKGDLSELIDDELVPKVTPLEIPLNILVKPSIVSSIDWALIVSDILTKVMKIDPRKASNIVKVILSGYIEKYINDPKKLLLDPDLSILSSVIDLITTTPNYDKAIEYISKGVLFDLNGYGTAYQNIYGSLILHLAAYLVSSGKLRDKLIVIDEAWRIGSVKALYTLVKEGRSRRVGIVLATQNIEDIPSEIIENIHVLIVFGSHSDEYLYKISRTLGLKRSVIESLKRLSIGEALILNSLDPHPVFVRMEPPSLLKKRAKTWRQY